MKYKAIQVLFGFLAVFGLLILSCEDNNQPLYGPGNPDPNPSGDSPAVINSIVPPEALPMEVVTINGSGFQPEPEYNTVVFGSKTATILSASATALEVELPPSSGNVKVRVSVKGSEFWSNEYDFTFKSFVPDIPNPEAAVIDSEIAWPNGIDIDNDGNIYIGSKADEAIYKITPDGTKSHFADVPVSGAIHFGPQNYLYVCSGGDNGIGKVFRISPDGSTVEEVVEVDRATDVDWDADGNMYIASADYGIYMLDAGGSLTEVASDIGSVKNCRVFGGYLYVSKIWEDQIVRFEITGTGLGDEEVYLEGEAPSSFDFDENGTLYWAHAWEISLYVYAPGGAEEAILYEEELMTPMRYMVFHKEKIYVVFPGWGDVGQTMSVLIGLQQAPRYGRN